MTSQKSSLDKYNLMRPKMKTGDALTWEGDYWLSWLIRRWTHRSHASSIVRLLPLPHGQEDVQTLIVEADQGEVNVRRLSKKLKRYKGKCYWHPLKPEFWPHRKAIGDFLWYYVGEPYDYFSLLKNPFGCVKSKCKRLFCSEYVGGSYWNPWKDNGKPGGIPFSKLILLLAATKNKELEKLLDGKALRPGDIAKLPIFDKEVRVL